MRLSHLCNPLTQSENKRAALYQQEPRTGCYWQDPRFVPNPKYTKISSRIGIHDDELLTNEQSKTRLEYIAKHNKENSTNITSAPCYPSWSQAKSQHTVVTAPVERVLCSIACFAADSNCRVPSRASSRARCRGWQRALKQAYMYRNSAEVLCNRGAPRQRVLFDRGCSGTKGTSTECACDKGSAQRVVCHRECPAPESVCSLRRRPEKKHQKATTGPDTNQYL